MPIVPKGGHPALKRQAMFRLNNTRANMLNMTLRDFAERYGMSYGQAMDIEQMRSFPSLATRTLIEAVRRDPERIARAAAASRNFYGSAIE